MSDEPRQWSDLPELPLATIANLLLPIYRDLISFASVCNSWRTLLRSLSPSLLSSLPPLLLTPSFRLLSPSTLLPPFSFAAPLLPSPSSFKCLSFSHGHLLLLSSSPAPLHALIVDVITGSRILLPPFPSLPSDHHRYPYYYATLTAPPSSPTSLFLLFFCKFAFLSCQVSNPNATWTRHNYSPNISFITRVVPFGNRLFGLNDCARLLEFDLSSDQTDVVHFSEVPRPPHAPSDFDRWHFGPQLVPSSGQLLLVLFLYDKETNVFRSHARARDANIKVYSLDWRKMEWVEVKNLHNCAIFIDCAGKSPVLCEKPERWGGESNCVYVTGPRFDKWMMCSLDDKKGRRMRPAVFDIPASFWPSPIWIHPSLFYG